MESMHATSRREPWNKGKLVGQKAPLKLKRWLSARTTESVLLCDARSHKL
jgi:hypothetical protein